MDQFAAEMSELLKLPNTWDNNGREEHYYPRTQRCQGFTVSVEFGKESPQASTRRYPQISIVDDNAMAELKKRVVAQSQERASERL